MIEISKWVNVTVMIHWAAWVMNYFQGRDTGTTPMLAFSAKNRSLMGQLTSAHLMDKGNHFSFSFLFHVNRTKSMKQDSPLASEILLVEHGSVGAQERVLDGGKWLGHDRAHVEHLAARIHVSVVACK